MKAHFVITTSANEKMERQVEFLIRSIKSIGRCRDSFFTIMTHEPEKISNAYIKRHEIIGYKQDVNLKYAWSVCARWDVTPAADTIIALDADVVALRDLNPLLEQLQNGMSGTIADGFFNFSIENWKELFDLASIRFPEKTYVSSVGKEGSPYYINNGVVALSSEYLTDIRRATKKMIELVNTIHYDDYFITQRANTLAAYACNVPLNVMSKDFNHLEFSYGQPTKDTYFFHYNISRDKSEFSPARLIDRML